LEGIVDKYYFCIISIFSYLSLELDEVAFKEFSMIDAIGRFGKLIIIVILNLNILSTDEGGKKRN